jgi:hypothetical protein
MMATRYTAVVLLERSTCSSRELNSDFLEVADDTKAIFCIHTASSKICVLPPAVLFPGGPVYPDIFTKLGIHVPKVICDESL